MADEATREERPLQFCSDSIDYCGRIANIVVHTRGWAVNPIIHQDATLKNFLHGRKSMKKTFVLLLFLSPAASAQGLPWPFPVYKTAKVNVVRYIDAISVEYHSGVATGRIIATV